MTRVRSCRDPVVRPERDAQDHGLPPRMGDDDRVSDEVVAEVKGILAFGEGESATRDLAGFTPGDREMFGFNAQIFIGSVGSDRYDSFDIVVCSPSWFAKQVRDGHWERFDRRLRALPEAVLPGAGIWFMRRWDEREFRASLDAVCRTFSPGPDFGSVAARIGRLIPWEFDYKHDDEVNGRAGIPPRA
jgi:hypothetical protein